MDKLKLKGLILLMLSWILPFLTVDKVQATEFFSSSFENFSGGHFTDWTDTINSPTQNSTIHYSGLYSMRVSNDLWWDNTGTFQDITGYGLAGTTFEFDVRVRVENFTLRYPFDGGYTLALLGGSDSYGGVLYGFSAGIRNDSGTYRWTMYDMNNYIQINSSESMNLNQWYIATLQFELDGSSKLQKADFFIGNTFIAETTTPPDCLIETVWTGATLVIPIGALGYGYATTFSDFCHITNTLLVPSFITCNSVIIVDLSADKYVYAGSSYIFRATYSDSNGTDQIGQAKISFTDGTNWINASYSNGGFGLDSGEGIVTIGGSATNTSTTTLVVDFQIFFTNKIVDTTNVDIFMYVNSSEYNLIDGWTEKQTDYFNIWNIGGGTTIESGGNAGRKEGGDVFDIYAEENSWVRVNQTWTNLKAVDCIFAVNSVGNDSVDEGNGGDMHSIGFFWFGMDAYDEVANEWDSWYVRLEVYDSYMGWAVPNTVHSWVVYEATWYMNGIATGKQDYVAGYWEGKSSSNDYARLHLRFWFNRANQSSVVGGWISPEYYGVETGSAWDWITGSWIPKKTYLPSGGAYQPAVNSFSFLEFKNSTGDIKYYRDFTKQRFWVMVNRTSSQPNYSYEISFTQKLDYTFKSDKEGIDTPAPLEPAMPDIPQGGLFGWIASTLGGLATSVFNTFSGGFSVLARVIVGGIDALLLFIFGTPNMFSGFLTGVQLYLSQLGTIVSNAGMFLVNIVTFMSNFFTGLGQIIINFINGFVWWIQQLIMIIPNAIQLFTDMWNGTGAFSGGIALKDMAMLIGIGILLWFVVGIEVYGISWGIEQIQMISQIAMVLLNFLMWFFNTLVQVVQFVLSFIPFVG